MKVGRPDNSQEVWLTRWGGAAGKRLGVKEGFYSSFKMFFFFKLQV